eukprot:4072537-Amphidinium_carterae.1
MTGIISLVGDADPSASQELKYLHRVIADSSGRRPPLSPWRLKFELETGANGKDLPSVKLSAVELGQIAATAAMT